MTSSWKTTIVAAAAALALLGGGVAAAKYGNGHGPAGNGHGSGNGHGNGGHGGRGGGHGHRGQGHGGPGNGGVSCDAVASTIGAFVDAACPCDGIDDGAGGTIAWRNHGQYVRCVAHAVKEAARTVGAKRRCGRSLVPCAARSSCGKEDAVACVVSVPGTCSVGVCSDDPDDACLTDADCDVPTCSVRSAEECTAAGGTGGAGSCCSASPSGAFVD